MDKIDKIIKNKYKKIKVPRTIGKNIINNNKSILKICACIIFLLVISSLTIYYFFKEKNNIYQANNDISSSGDSNIDSNIDSLYNLPIANDSLILSADMASYKRVPPDVIGIVELQEIIECTNYSKIKDLYMRIPITRLKVKKVKSLRGDMEEEFVINKNGGIITIYDYEKSLSNDNKLLIYSQYKDLNDDEKKNLYIDINFSCIINTKNLEIGKKYLVSLKEDNEAFEGLCTIGNYGIVEYDTFNNKIKNVQTNEWEDIDMKRYD